MRDYPVCTVVEIYITTLTKHQPNDKNIDVAIIAAIMDEIAGVAPEGTSEAIERVQHKRTCYNLPFPCQQRTVRTAIIPIEILIVGVIHE